MFITLLYYKHINLIIKDKKMLRPGFEPESSARKAEMIGRTTPTEQLQKIRHNYLITAAYLTYLNKKII